MIFLILLAVAAQESQTSLLSTVMQQEMAQRRQRAGISRQDSRLSVKSLIESIEKTSSHVSNCKRKNAEEKCYLNESLYFRLNRMVKPVTHTVRHPV